MDLWVVAAAAGAGYLAKYWNKSLNNGDSSHHLSSEDSFLENPESSSCPFSFRKKTRRGELGKDVSLDGRASDGKSADGLLTGERVSKRGFNYERLRQCRNYSESDLLSISNLAVPLSPYDDNVNDVEDGNEQNADNFGNNGFFLPEFSAKVVPIHNSFGNKTFLRTKHLPGYASRPLNSLESCFMAQLYKEHAKMEEYVFSPLSSASTGTRSFVVSNGSRIVNRGCKGHKLHKAGRVQDENIVGVPSLPKVGSLSDTKKVRFDAVIGQSRRLSSSDDGGKLINTQYGPTFLFSLGISFGMITSIMAYKREIDKLRELLKQSDNLVQDLQEELEMNDSMTVKEIHNENYGSQDTCDHSFNGKELNELSPEKHMENSPRIDCKEEDSSDFMSKIEAELEAELERLGLDMNASSLERKLSELVEIEPEFVADFAQGELRADKLSGKDIIHPKSNEDANEITPLPGNYAVLPHELSLRLHEVIQSQLEERVKELEIALEQSQRKVKLLESEHESSFQKETSLTSGNLLTYEDCDTETMSQPLVLNLSGEALDAYNEAYEELIKINDSEEDSPSEIHDWNATIGDQHEVANGVVASSTVDERTLSKELYTSKVTMLEGKSSSINELSVSEDDENCDCDNELEKQLIRQIVERTKKGSPFVQHAQKILYSMDEDEH